jgi:hypothetical protein
MDALAFSFLGLSASATAVIAGFYTLLILVGKINSGDTPRINIGGTHIHADTINNFYTAPAPPPKARRGRVLKRVLGAWAVAIITLLALPSSASAEFGLQLFDITFNSSEGGAELRAGSHPESLVASLEAITEPGPEGPIPEELLKDITVTQIPGFAGDLGAVPRCATLDFLADPLDPLNGHLNATRCPNSTAVGFFRAVAGEGGVISEIEAPLYNLEPPPGKVARLGFKAIFPFLTIDIGLSPTFPYSPYAEVTNATQLLEFISSELTVWGVPADPIHDKLRGTCMKTGKSCSAGVSPRPFLTMPRACEGPLKSTWRADSWLHPGVWKEGFAETHDEAIPTNPAGMRECGKLVFDPATQATPSSASAESSSGLDFEINVSDEGLKNPTGTAKADISKVAIEFPVGVTANPSAAEGLGVCSLAQYGAESLTNRACPDAAKLGSLEAETPLLEHTFHGSLYLAAQDDPASPGKENPFDSLLALYMIVRDPELGVFIKLPVKVEPDPSSGRLIATAEEIPPFPLSRVLVHMRSGARAPLVTPPACGTYTTKATLTPSSGAAPLISNSQFTIDSGPGGGPCPLAGPPPFNPTFEAGAINNAASQYTPFSLRLTRQDGEGELTRVSTTFPPGVTGKLAGVGKCPDAAIEAAKLKSGRQEIAAPSCPADSRVGRIVAGAGVGSALTYAGGTLYLAGPYKGGPVSVVSIVPAVAGPFDVGTIVTRFALVLNPNTAEVEVDGAASDPIPHILKGIPLVVRDIRVYVDRPNFMLNPTSCAKLSTKATIFGSGLDVFSPADDVAVTATSPFQAASCASLGFGPKVSVALKGGTKRDDHPALRATVTYPYPSGPGYANIGQAAITLPSTQFIDNDHINNPCTRVKFNENACPASSVLGSAKAITPLLDEPLEGPVYFRSNGGERLLPDVVADLHGAGFRFIAVIAVKAKNGRLRSRVLNAPDAPVTSFTVSLKGGKEGLLVNSANLCKKKRYAKVELTGQNGRIRNSEIVVKTSCKGKGKKRPARHGR